MNSDSLDSSKILQRWYHYHPHQWYISRAASVPLHPCSENFNSPFNHRNTQRSKFLSLLGKWGMKGSGTCGENAPPRSLLQGRVCSSSCEQLQGCLQLQRATLPQGTSFQGCPCQVINHKRVQRPDSDKHGCPRVAQGTGQALVRPESRFELSLSFPGLAFFPFLLYALIPKYPTRETSQLLETPLYSSSWLKVRGQ